MLKCMFISNSNGDNRIEIVDVMHIYTDIENFTDILMYVEYSFSDIIRVSCYSKKERDYLLKTMLENEYIDLSGISNKELNVKVTTEDIEIDYDDSHDYDCNLSNLLNSLTYGDIDD